MSRHTHTSIKLGVSQAVFDEIRKRLEQANYVDLIHYAEDGQVILDMHGLALVSATPASWEAFAKWHKANEGTRPRSWEYHKAPAWLLAKYRKWMDHE